MVDPPIWDSLEPSLELATPGKIPHPHSPRDRPDTLVKLEDLEHASPLVLGPMLSSSEHERYVVAEHRPDVSDEFLYTRSVPLELVREKAVKTIRRVSVVMADLHTVLKSQRSRLPISSFSRDLWFAYMAHPPDITLVPEETAKDDQVGLHILQSRFLHAGHHDLGDPPLKGDRPLFPRYEPV